MKLTDSIIRKKVKAMAGRKGKRTCRFCAVKDARRILVVCNWTDKKAVEPCIKELRKQNKQVDVCVYVAGKLMEEIDPSYILIQGETDLNMWYIPKNEAIKRFNACDADVIIDLSHSNDYAMQYLLLQHPAAFRVGARNSEADLYDLSVSLTESVDLKHLFEHLLFYMQTIRQK